MHHEPEPTLLVCLKFNEVIPAAEGGELDSTFSPTDRLRARMAERAARQVLGLRNDLVAVMPAGRHSPPKVGQYLASYSRVQGCGLHVQAHSQHPAADIASNRVRVDQG